ncbi:hypothetical protein BCR44DRAFT_1049101 [Catenaria anguillulae PL171]|uniref:Uncharacterized protein n=1 Tax=Catenaria anguillulae PL171 TaxID=765915 RepID=A0A1Y2HT91_9FUNG|nr:hypothetical protein BCR44DRAFT_1049101 [Catenaria anguillulae PL171]
MFCVVFFMVLTLAFAIDLRSFEYSVLGVPRTPELRSTLTYVRSREGVVSFFSFFVIKVLSIGADVAFVSVLMASGRSVGKNARKLSKTEILSPYLTNVFFSVAYLAAVALTRFPWDPVELNYIQFTNITLSRFCPALEAFIFTSLRSASRSIFCDVSHNVFFPTRPNVALL